jgi:hypothetical protein
MKNAGFILNLGLFIALAGCAHTDLATDNKSRSVAGDGSGVKSVNPATSAK